MNQQSKETLFPVIEDRAEFNEWLYKRLNSALAEITNQGVSPTLDIERFSQALSAFDFSQSKDLNAVTEWVIANMRDGQVHMTHPRYFGLFNPAPTFPAEVADQIVAAFNPQICVWSHAPVAVEIEAHVIAKVAARLGLPADAGGHFTSGGSEANHTAVLCALTQSIPEFASLGARACAGQPRIYVSRESHLAWFKIAHECGIGRNAVVLIDTDGMGCMNADALSEMIAADLAAGHVPIMIAATAGTTNAGMVDPLRDCSKIASTHEIWLHVDAAWGGALAASNALRHSLDGIERADSVTIDAHKWFATTMGAGMFFTAHQSVLADVFHVATDYMPSNDQSVDLYVNSMQWSRRFIGLRLFLALAAVGWQGYSDHVEHGVALIARLNKNMQKAGWRVTNDSRMAVTCLQPPEGDRDVETIVNEVVAGNAHWVSVTRFENTPVVRACITNGRTTSSDVDALAAALIAAGSD